MRFAIFKGEETVNDVASRLFHVRGRGSQHAMKQAIDGLLKANPQLKNLSKVPVGALITVPDAAPPITPGEQATSAALVRTLVPNVQAALDSLQQRLSDIETAAFDRVKFAAEQFQTPELKKALKIKSDTISNFVRAAPTLDSIGKDVKDTLKRIKTAQEARKQVVANVRAKLSSFAKMKSET
jgi:hypothetical protein